MNSKADDRGWSVPAPEPQMASSLAVGGTEEAEGCWRRNRRNDPSSLSSRTDWLQHVRAMSL